MPSDTPHHYRRNSYTSELTRLLPDDNTTETDARSKNRQEQYPNEIIESGHDDWASKFEIDLKTAQKIASPEFIVPDLVIRGHLVIFPAPSGAGKTAIMMHESANMAELGYEVFYINSDIAAVDMPKALQEAEDGGFRLLLPDAVTGVQSTDILSYVEQDLETGTNLSNRVLIFDTIKKFTDIINKKRAKELLGLLRGATGQGATVIALAHTNKHLDSEGNPVFEGVGDVRADCDELIYLEAAKKGDALIVSTRPDKVRGAIKPITYKISSDRKVERNSEFVDTARANQVLSELQARKPMIKEITKVIQEYGEINQSQILEELDTRFKYGRRIILSLLKKFSMPGVDNQFWVRNKHGRNNAWLYSLHTEVNHLTYLDDK